MDNLTTLTTTIACTKRLLQKLQENIKWARLKIKPNKSRSLSVIKGKLVEHRFLIGKEPIPTVAEKPVKSLGGWYDASLKDRALVDQIRVDTISGLKTIDKTLLPGRMKLWCLQFGLLSRLMWPLTIYEVPLSTVEHLEQLVRSFAKKWLGLPRCITNTALYGKGILGLPVSSLTEEFKCAKVGLEMTLTESQNPNVAQTAPTLSTGREWTPAVATQQAQSALRHQDVVGHIQRGRGGLGTGESRPSWHKATPTQRRGLVVEEVHWQEQAVRCAKAVTQAKQGQWMQWEEVEKRRLSWKELWGMEAHRVSFLIRAICNILPSPVKQWYGEDPKCPLCPSPASLKHILVGCKKSLSHGHYTWRHNQVLRCLAAAIETRRIFTNALPPPPPKPTPAIAFVNAGATPKPGNTSKVHPCQLGGA